MKIRRGLLVAACVLAALGYAYWKLAIPVHRVEIRSELIMLGDLDGDRKWTSEDLIRLDAFLSDPFRTSDEIVRQIDMNQNGLIDLEDLSILRALVSSAGDPYAAEEKARSAGAVFPRPRELYRYVSAAEYHQRPQWALPYPHATDSALTWLGTLPKPVSSSPYAAALNAAIYAEAVRFDVAWRQREPLLLPIERSYAERKLSRARSLYDAGEMHELLLALIELVEDAETLTTRDQPELPLKLLVLRDDLREILGSVLYDQFKSGSQSWQAVLDVVSKRIQADVGLNYDFPKLSKPRNLTNLENYVQRAEWQYYKSTTREEDFRVLINYAQHDPRYRYAVSRTSRKLRDPNVENHNLPMVLLFREALRINGGDKKKAVGLLDEAIRIPYAWVKSIPRASLPGSLALDNFLLPGNKEDGADKSRHWNVFGGVCLYKSPQEALDLALKREMQDLRDDRYSENAMREFFRDMIADLNGMYHVMTVNPALLSGKRR